MESHGDAQSTTHPREDGKDDQARPGEGPWACQCTQMNRTNKADDRPIDTAVLRIDFFSKRDTTGDRG